MRCLPAAPSSPRRSCNACRRRARRLPGGGGQRPARCAPGRRGRGPGHLLDRLAGPRGATARPGPTASHTSPGPSLRPHHPPSARRTCTQQPASTLITLIDRPAIARWPGGTRHDKPKPCHQHCSTSQPKATTTRDPGELERDSGRPSSCNGGVASAAYISGSGASEVPPPCLVVLFRWSVADAYWVRLGCWSKPWDGGQPRGRPQGRVPGCCIVVLLRPGGQGDLRWGFVVT